MLLQMDDRVSVSRPWFQDYKFHLVSSSEQLRRLVDICVDRKLCSLDVESTGVDNRIYSDEYFEDGIKTRYGIRTIDRIAGVCISFDGQNGYYVPLSHEPEDSGNLPWDESWEDISRIVRSCKVIFHNAKFDAEFLYPVTGKEFWKIGEFEDTMLMAKVINPLKGAPAGLKPLTKQHYGVDMVDIDELFTQERKEQLKREKRRYNFALLHPKEGVEYGCSDGIFTYKLRATLSEKLVQSDIRIYELEKSFSNVMRKMERNRVHIDVERVQQLYAECKTELERVGDSVKDVIESRTGRTGRWLTLNVGSPKQLSQALITDPEGLRLKPTAEMIGSEESGWSVEDSDDDDDDEDEAAEKQYTLKDEALKSLQREYGKRLPSPRKKDIKDLATAEIRSESMFDLILEYRHYDKMKGSYVEKLFKSHDKYGDVRPSFNQMGTDTARLSCKAGKIEDGYSGVNFQGIPRDSDEDKPELFKQIRTCIAPRPGWMLVKIDYAGEELRVITNMSGDPIWKESFLHKDGDVHSITARILFGVDEVNKDQRNRGKRSNFAIIYGGGAGAISRNVGCSIEEGARHMDNMRSGLPVLMGYVDFQKKFAREHKCIFTAFGRRIPIPTIDSPIRMIRAKAERCAINYTIQSTSADVLKYALCYVDKNIRALNWEDKVRYVLTVHDEVVFEVRPDSLMEVTRKLDEWMTVIWKMPKMHGREWVVPLLTEPGIDINWKARYDFFRMVDGIPAKPWELDADGGYKGKLKKDEYFHDGKVYQKIPDFLQAHVFRNDCLPGRPDAPALPASGDVPASEVPPAASLPAASLPEKEPVLALPEPVDPPEPNPSQVDLKKEIDATVDFMMDSSMDVGIGLGDVPDRPAPASTVKPASVGKSNGAVKSKETAKTSDSESVLRWELKATPSKSTMRKLHALCILTEGETLLRVIAGNSVVMSESVGVRVDPAKFKVLAEFMGLG